MAIRPFSIGPPVMDRTFLRRLGQRIRDRREIMTLSLDQLSAQVGITHVDLDAIESGQRDPAFTTLCLIARALGTPVAHLLEDGHER
jgi:transcriptional regulator with XRE-family HTH domain